VVKLGTGIIGQHLNVGKLYELNSRRCGGSFIPKQTDT